MLAQSPSTSHIAGAQPIPNSNHHEHSKPSQQPMSFSVPESGHSYRQAQVTRPYPVVRANPSLGKEPKLRSDLQGVVLTLGPGSGHGGS